MITISEITVTTTVKVEIDPAKFTDQFLEEFREAFYPFHTLDDHREHLAQLHARGLVHNRSFIEGYGLAADMGIRFDTTSTETTLERTVDVPEKVT